MESDVALSTYGAELGSEKREFIAGLLELLE
jgi:hypothetical protein